MTIANWGQTRQSSSKIWFSTCFGYLSGLCLRYDFLLRSFFISRRRASWRMKISHDSSMKRKTRNRDSCTELLHMAPPAFWRKRWNFHVFIFLFLCCFRSQVIKHATLLIKRSETSQNKCAISTEVNMGESNRYFVVPDENRRLFKIIIYINWENNISCCLSQASWQKRKIYRFDRLEKVGPPSCVYQQQKGLSP